ncbi:MAG: ribosome small subunit-dependent GTPase A [Planctomycetota bacterium]|nr:ribosome small subunit-dependent GTPase A [Planctomycetota bacterium]
MSAPERAATVVRLDARGCLVRLDEPIPGLAGDGLELWCGVRGRIHLRDRRHQKTPVAVGDRVQVVHSQEDRGAVVAIEARRSTLSRPAVRGGRVEHVMAANVDRVVIVSALDEPPFNPALVDRILAVVEFSHLEALIVVNKADLGTEPPPELAAYEALGYPTLLASALTGAGIAELRAQLGGRTSVVAGHSGVGKSSLLNAVQAELGLAVGGVNAVTGRGTHTTTAAVWLGLEGGGAVIDTAGVREFGLFGISKRELPWLFRDVAALAPSCRYPDCSHTHEPSCGVQEALLDGRIAAFRFESYLKMLESLDEQVG